MKPSLNSSPARRRRFAMLSPLLVMGIMAIGARAADLSMPSPRSPRELAFARYIGLHANRDPLVQSQPLGVLIEASLPGLYKSATVSAIRTQAENGWSELRIIDVSGDGTVAQEVIGRCLSVEQQIELLPLFSVAITPAKYKFHFAGDVKTGGSTAYIYNVTPKKKGPGAVGQLWMDADTGQEVMLSGRLINLPATKGPVRIVRDTKLIDGFAFARVTHMTLTIPLLGRAEAEITEIILDPGIIAAPPQ